MPATSPRQHSQAKLNRIAGSIAKKWRGSRLAPDHSQDLEQEAAAYQASNGGDQWFILDLRQHLHGYASRWLYQSARPSTKGLRVLETGVLDATWLSPAPPSPEGQALARIELQRVWERSTKGQKKAIEALALADTDEKGGVLSAELCKFGIPNSDAFHERLKTIRRRGHA